MTTIKDLMQRAHATAKSKGWWDDLSKYNFGQSIALMHSELSEALEEYRRHGLRPTKPMPGICDHLCEEVGYLYYASPEGEAWSTPESSEGELLKPEGVAAEFADVLIRIFDTCEHHGIPLEQALKQKMAYNESRDYRHGGKLC